MKPISVRFQCFGPYMAEQFIDFEELEKNGLFLICGETGAGKTTILDAMCYALYGRSSGGLRGDISVMRCSLAPKEQETFTEFIFETNGRRYKFVRGLKYGRKNLNDSHNCLVWEDGVWVPVFENPKATNVNQKARELIGLTYDQFRQVIILPQGQFEKLLVSDSAEKEKILVSLFHADRWQRIAEEIYRRVAERDAELKQQKLRITARLAEYGCGDLAALEEKRVAQTFLAEQLKEQTREAEQQMRAIQERSHQALLEYKEFEALFLLQRQYARLEERIPQAREEENLLKTADVAETLRPQYQQYQDAENLCLRARKASAQAAQLLQQACGHRAAAQQKMQQHSQARPGYEDRRQQLVTLKNARPLYKTLTQKEGSVRTAEQNFRQAKQVLERAEQNFTRTDNAWQRSVLAQKEAIERFQAVQNAYLKSIGSVLAQKLVPGDACPVCGSTHHPDPAKPGENPVSEVMLQRADKAMKDANEASSAALDQRTAAEKQKIRALDGFQQAHRVLAEATSEYEAALAAQIPGIADDAQLELQISRVEKTVTAFEQEEVNLSALLADARGKETAALERSAAADRELQEADEQHSIQAAAWQQALRDSGLLTLERFRKADLRPEEKQRRTVALLQFRTDLERTKQLLEEKQTALSGRTSPDREAIRKELAESENRFRTLSGQQLLAEDLLQKMEQTGNELTKASEHYARHRQAVDADLDFANRLRGRSGVSLQRYVLGVMLTSITVEANRLLSTVYAGRYRLYRTDEIAGSGHKGGLELEVFDSQTSQRRSVTTLSGGEKFLVALSLAIGLSTVVQAQGSGIRLEAMFIDEGFGSLDRDAVQDALQILQGIQRTSGVVGIISHVEQLAEIIPARLEITKGKQGSLCHIRT